MGLYRVGLEIQPDSTAYIRGAINLRDGLGYTYNGDYISHFPPGYSFILALLLKVFPYSVYTLGFGLNMVFLGLLGTLFSYWLDRFKLVMPVILLSTLCFMFSVPVYVVSAKFLTELPSLLILLGACIGLKKHFDNNQANMALWLVGILLALGFFVRFAMLGFCVGFVLSPFVLFPNNRLSNFKKSVIMGTPTLLSVLAGQVYVNLVYGEQAIDREFLWHPIPLYKLKQFLLTPLHWFHYSHQASTTNTFLWVSMILITLILLVFFRKKNRDAELIADAHNPICFLKSMILIACCYLLFIIVSISCFDALTPVNTRILSLLAPMLFLSIALMMQHLYVHAQNRMASLTLLIGLTLMFSLQGLRALNKPRFNAYHAHIAYLTPKADSLLRNAYGQWVAPGKLIYNNHPTFFRLLCECPNKKIPNRYDMVNERPNAFLGQELNHMQEEIGQGQSQLLYFNKAPRRGHELTRTEVLKLFSDSSQYHIRFFSEGFIVRAQQP